MLGLIPGPDEDQVSPSSTLSEDDAVKTLVSGLTVGFLFSLLPVFTDYGSFCCGSAPHTLCCRSLTDGLAQVVSAFL